MLPQMIAMITGENDDGLFTEPKTFQSLKHAAYLGIHETHTGPVGLYGLTTKGVGQQIVFGLVTPQGHGREILDILLHSLHQTDACGGVSSKVGFGRHIGCVGAIEAQCQKKRAIRPLGKTLQQPDGILSEHTIGMLCIRLR